jgi:RNA polymerase sigma factor (sigma-70 family)
MTPEQRFEENMCLVGFVYQRKFHEYSAYQEDLIQEGFLGLWKACLNFDESRGIQFSTYAYTAIERTMMAYIDKFILKHSSVVSLNSVIAEDSEGNQVYLCDSLGTEEDHSIKYAIQDSLSKMSQKDQSILYKLMDGLTQDCIAKACHTSQPTVSRCLAKFRKILSKEMEEI